jgi:hypothetical protein
MTMLSKDQYLEDIERLADEMGCWIPTHEITRVIPGEDKPVIDTVCLIDLGEAFTLHEWFQEGYGSYTKGRSDIWYHDSHPFNGPVRKLTDEEAIKRTMSYDPN